VSNPFDPDLIRLDAEFSGPGGGIATGVEVPGFWRQEFERRLVNGSEVLSGVGSGDWRVRWWPRQAGTHQVVLTVRTNGVVWDRPLTNTFEVSAWTQVPAGVGLARVARGGRYFETEYGRALPLVGACVCWPGRRGTYDYDDWVGAMAGAGANYLRLWMAPWAFGVEAEPGTRTRYRQDRAWQLDYVLRLAEERGLCVMLCLDYHGMFEVEPDYWGGNNYWGANPYNTAQGGPCANQDAFFTSAEAKAVYRKRLRYLVARYGSSPNLLAWQFFNEIDNVYRYLDAGHVAAWHAEMGAWLKANDPWRHLVTTSLTGGSDRPEIWSLPALDFAVYHSYGQAQPAQALPAVAASSLARYAKPMMVGEFGTDWRGWRREQDPQLRGWRQGIWAGALGGSVGTAMSWWWENIHAENLYGTYATLGRLLHGTDWGRDGTAPVGFRTNGEPPPTLGDAVVGGLPFAAQLALGSQWGAKPRGQFALANALGAGSAGSYLNAFVHGTGHPELKVPLRVQVWLGAGARLVLHVNSVSDGARMGVLVDGVKVLDQNLPNLDGTYQVNNEYNRDYAVTLAAGKHLVEVRNLGGDWFYLDWLRFEQVLPAAYTGDWQPSPVACGLKGMRETLVYAVSPAASFPVQATNTVIDPWRGGAVVLTNQAAGRYQASWFDPATGAVVGESTGEVVAGVLSLRLPDFREDLFGRVRVVGEVRVEPVRWGGASGFEGRVVGPAERSYWIETWGGTGPWESLLLVTNVDGAATFADAGAARVSRRFYRARLAP
jgi:hypothetical protein